MARVSPFHQTLLFFNFSFAFQFCLRFLTGFLLFCGLQSVILLRQYIDLLRTEAPPQDYVSSVTFSSKFYI